MESVIVLNYDYQYLNKISWKRAVCLIYSGKAEVLKQTTKLVRNAEKTIALFIPLVLRLLRLVRAVYRQKVPFSRKNVMVRDGFKCQYCGGSEDLTVDHIVPKSRGGKTTFENCVAACKPCNSRKRNRTPSEAGVYPMSKPYEPTIMEFIMIQMRKENIDSFLKEIGVY